MRSLSVSFPALHCTMFSVRRSIATRCLGMPLRKAIESAARMGADGIQLDVRFELNARELSDTGRRQFLHSLGQFNLQLGSTFLPTRSALYDKTNLDARISGVRGAMEFTRQLGADLLMLSAGPIPDEESDEYTTLVEVLNALAEHGNHVGTTLCLRSGSSSPDELTKLIDRITTGPLGIDFDPAAAMASGRDALGDYSTLHKRVRHVRGVDSALASENSHVEVGLGLGRVPWMELMVMLQEARYDGWVAVERTIGSTKSADIAGGLELLKSYLPA